MAVDNPVKVTRYGRNERTTHSDPASAEVTAGDLIERTNGEVAPAADTLTQDDRLLIALDDRERGMELGDTYAAGESTLYVAPSGGAFNVFLAGGETVDPSTEERLVAGADGKVRPFNAGGGDVAADVIFKFDGDGAVTAPAGEPTAIPVVVN